MEEADLDMNEIDLKGMRSCSMKCMAEYWTKHMLCTYPNAGFYPLLCFSLSPYPIVCKRSHEIGIGSGPATVAFVRSATLVAVFWFVSAANAIPKRPLGISAMKSPFPTCVTVV